MRAPQNVRRYRPLFELVDTDKLNVPSVVTDGRAAVTRLADAVAVAPMPTTASDVLDGLVDDATVTDDPSSLDVSGLVAVEQTNREREDRHRVLVAALERADQSVGLGVAAHVETIIGAIAELGDEHWSEVTSTVKALGDTVIERDALLRAPNKVRAAWLSLDALAARHVRLAHAHDVVRRADAALQHDVRGEHGEYREGLCVIVGRGWQATGTNPAPVMPWPTEIRDRLVWQVRTGHAPWWPTAAEQDRAWHEAHAEEAAHQALRQSLHHTAHSWSAVAG